MFDFAAWLAHKCEVPEAKDVERREQRRDETDKPEDLAACSLKKCRVEDGVFGKKAREGGKSGDGKDGRGHGPKSDGHFGAQATHLAQVLLAAHVMNDGTGGEEKQRLEERVHDEMEDGCGVGRDPAGKKHVAELGDRRVGEYALDVVLDEANGGGEEGRDRTDDGHRPERNG